MSKEERLTVPPNSNFLLSTHRHVTVGQVFSYTRQFFTFDTSAYPTINEAYEKLTNLNNELRRVGNHQSELNCKFALLRSLPSRYEAKVDYLKTQMASKTLFEMKLELEDKEREIKDKANTHVGMIARRRKDADARVQAAEAKVHQFYAAQARNRQARPSCEHCNKRGHSKDACWELHPELKDEWENTDRGRNRGGKGKGRAAISNEADSETHQAHFASRGRQ